MMTRYYVRKTLKPREVTIWFAVGGQQSRSDRTNSWNVTQYLRRVVLSAL